eukprot:3256112-Pyramimonas_sp.AAC.1
MVNNLSCLRILDRQILCLLICAMIWPVVFFMSRVPLFWPPRKCVALTERRHFTLWAFLADVSYSCFTRCLDLFDVGWRGQWRGAW